VIRVLGLGNVLMSDDGFGPFVVEHLLARYEFGADVEVIDVGTPGLDLTPYLGDAAAVVIVDTVKSQGAPGELRLYRKAQLLRHPPQPRTSPHDPGLSEALFALTLAGTDPGEVLLVGAIPEHVGMGSRLSPALQAAVEPAALEVVTELRRLGATARVREPQAEVKPWWIAGREHVDS